jgi:voltage-gated potassium channel
VGHDDGNHGRLRRPLPVTATGRLVGVALMLVGISLVGLVTASVAAWFIAATRKALNEEEAHLEERLRRLEEQLAQVHAAVVVTDLK